MALALPDLLALGADSTLTFCVATDARESAGTLSWAARMNARLQAHGLEYQRLWIHCDACLKMRAAHQHGAVVDGAAVADRCTGYRQHTILKTVQLHLSVNHAVIADIDGMQSDICKGKPINVRWPIRQPKRLKIGFASAVPDTVLIKPVMRRKKQS